MQRFLRENCKYYLVGTRRMVMVWVKVRVIKVPAGVMDTIIWMGLG